MTNSILPLRIGVGAIVLNEHNKVLVGKRKDNPIDKWQMPQGGVDKNEDLYSAMRRELYEETSITSFKLIREIKRWLTYELPANLKGKIWKGKFRGQKQKWYILRFTGDDKEINVKTKNPEFIDWKWIKIEELPQSIVDFKKKVYEDLVEEINKTID
jgi:putative (di)nucleoside polyphosphate hydrolase